MMATHGLISDINGPDKKTLLFLELVMVFYEVKDIATYMPVIIWGYVWQSRVSLDIILTSEPLVSYL